MPYLTQNITTSSCSIDGSAFILFEKSGEILSLNETGSFIWRQIRRNCTTQQIIAAVLSEYDGDEQEVADSTVEFIRDLANYHAVLVSDSRFEGVDENV